MTTISHRRLEVDASLDASTESGGHATLVAHGSTMTLDVSSLGALRDLTRLGGLRSPRKATVVKAERALALAGLVCHVDVVGRRIASIGDGVTSTGLARLLGLASTDIRMFACARAALHDLRRRFRGEH